MTGLADSRTSFSYRPSARGMRVRFAGTGHLQGAFPQRVSSIKTGLLPSAACRA